MTVEWFEPKAIASARAKTVNSHNPQGSAQQFKMFLLTVVMLSFAAALNLLNPNPNTPGLWQMVIILLGGAVVITYGLPIFLGKIFRWIPLAVRMDEKQIMLMRGNQPIKFPYDDIRDLSLDTIQIDDATFYILRFFDADNIEVVIGYPEKKHDLIHDIYRVVWPKHSRDAAQAISPGSLEDSDRCTEADHSR